MPIARTGRLGASGAELGNLILAFKGNVPVGFSNAVTLTSDLDMSAISVSFSSSMTMTADMVASGLGTSFSSSITLTPAFVGETGSSVLTIYEGAGSLTGGFQVLGGL